MTHSRLSHWVALVLQAAAGATVLGAGLGHTLSILSKIDGYALESRFDAERLFVIGALLILAGLGGLWGAWAILRRRRLTMALATAAVMLAMVLLISVVHDEYRGLGVAVPPALALGALMFERRRARSVVDPAQ